METFLMYFLFAIGIVLIVKGGDWFVDGAAWLAEVTGIPKFIVGATIISFATTLPEIIVSSMAAVEGHKILISGIGNYIVESQEKVGMAIGNGIGSVICNTAFIMAISLITYRFRFGAVSSFVKWSSYCVGGNGSSCNFSYLYF